MAKSHRMTPARRAALKKAQAASARKRRGKGKGKLAKSNKQVNHYKRAVRRQRIGNAVAIAGAAAAVGGALYLSHRQGQKQRARDYAQRKDSSKANYKIAHDSLQRDKFKKKTRPHARSRGSTKHNRIFATSRHGTTSVRTRY